MKDNEQTCKGDLHPIYVLMMIMSEYKQRLIEDSEKIKNTDDILNFDITITSDEEGNLNFDEATQGVNLAIIAAVLQALLDGQEDEEGE